MRSGNAFAYSKIRRTFTLVAFILLAAVPSFLIADEREVKFSEGNKLYQARDYEGAIKKYEEALQAGSPLAEIHFNLGNAYYKTGNFPAAIINFERARRLKPDDEDIQFNLRLANLNTVDKIDPVPQLFYERWWYSFINGSTASMWSSRSMAMLWLALGLALVYLFSRNLAVRKASFTVAVLLLITSGFFLYLANEQDDYMKNNRSAIITETSAYIKSSPDDKSVNLFMLHAGTRVEIIDELQGWKKVRIANGNVGWIMNEDVEVI